jgi:hypothetical protein
MNNASFAAPREPIRGVQISMFVRGWAGRIDAVSAPVARVLSVESRPDAVAVGRADLLRPGGALAVLCDVRRDVERTRVGHE